MSQVRAHYPISKWEWRVGGPGVRTGVLVEVGNELRWQVVRSDVLGLWGL